VVARTIRQFGIVALVAAATIVLIPAAADAQSAMLRVGKGQAEPLDFTPVDVGVAQGSPM
jgi:hypothetical protein